MNIKLDTIMDKLGVKDGSLIEAEDKSDRKLEQKKQTVQSKAENSRKKPGAAARRKR